jgi:hypothetical protein
MTLSRNLSIEEEQVFWTELFAVIVRREERIKVAGQVDRELAVPEWEPPLDSK